MSILWDISRACLYEKRGAIVPKVSVIIPCYNQEKCWKIFDFQLYFGKSIHIMTTDLYFILVSLGFGTDTKTVTCRLCNLSA